jgi:hypothetical protein
MLYGFNFSGQQKLTVGIIRKRRKTSNVLFGFQCYGEAGKLEDHISGPLPRRTWARAISKPTRRRETERPNLRSSSAALPPATGKARTAHGQPDPRASTVVRQSRPGRRNRSPRGSSVAHCTPKPLFNASNQLRCVRFRCATRVKVFQSLLIGEYMVWSRCRTCGWQIFFPALPGGSVLIFQAKLSAAT